MKIINPQEEIETEKLINSPSINRKKYIYNRTLGLPLLKEALLRFHNSEDLSDFEYFTNSYKEWILETNNEYEQIFTKELIRANNHLFFEQYSDRLDFPFFSFQTNPITQFVEDQYFGIQKNIHHNQFNEYKHLLKHHILGEEHLLKAISISSMNHEEKGFELIELINGKLDNTGLELLARKADYYNNDVHEIFPLQVTEKGLYDPLPMGRSGRHIHIYKQN